MYGIAQQYGMPGMPPTGAVGSVPVGQAQGRMGGSAPMGGSQGNKGGAGGRGRDRDSHSQVGGRKPAGELPSPNAPAGQPFMPSPYVNMVRLPTCECI
jgi:hypothetical protein